MGSRNCAARALQDFDKDKWACYSLFGKLLNTAPDLSTEEMRSTAKFRAITGGDTIIGERKYGDPFDFKPFARLLFSANQYPVLSNPTDATFRRWIIIPWLKTFRDTDKEIKGLEDKIKSDPAEMSGMLNWALAGLQRLMAQGEFTEARASTEALREFRTTADLLQRFLHESELPKRMERQAAFDKYKAWAHRGGHAAMGRSTFYDRLGELVGGARRVGREGDLLLLQGR